MSTSSNNLFTMPSSTRSRCLPCGGCRGGAADAAASSCAGDGWLDLFVTNYDAPNALYRNNGWGGFDKMTDVGEMVTDSAPSTGAAWADYDGASGVAAVGVWAAVWQWLGR